MFNITNPFEIKHIDEGEWSVNMDGCWVNVQTRDEAEILAQFPVLLTKLNGAKLDQSDKESVDRIIEICKDYGINSPASRRLRDWQTKYIRG